MPGKRYIRLTVPLPESNHDLAVAVLSDLGFYAFEEESRQLHAFANEGEYNSEAVSTALRKWFPDLPELDAPEEIEERNWNTEWEANWETVRIGDFLEIRPPWREAGDGFRLSLQINPRMAFGTGRHETTRLVASYMEQMDFSGKHVLDMGCGTGVLGILASKLGATAVVGVDIDEWSVENAPENIRLNDVKNMEILGGDAAVLPPDACYDIILANINRNVLIQDCPQYRSHLAQGGEVVLSGFFDFDADKVREAYEAQGLRETAVRMLNGWMLLAFELNA